MGNPMSQENPRLPHGLKKRPCWDKIGMEGSFMFYKKTLRYNFSPIA
jgi:hypothetical protein